MKRYRPIYLSIVLVVGLCSWTPILLANLGKLGDGLQYFAVLSGPPLVVAVVLAHIGLFTQHSGAHQHLFEVETLLLAVVYYSLLFLPLFFVMRPHAGPGTRRTLSMVQIGLLLGHGVLAYISYLMMKA